MLVLVITKSNESLSEVTGYFRSDDPIEKETKDIDSWVDIAFKLANKHDLIGVVIDDGENESNPLNVHASDEFSRKIKERRPSIQSIILDMKNNFPF